MQRRLVVLAVTAALLLGGFAGLGAGPATAAATAATAATTAATTSRQVVTVSAPSAESTFATVEAWARQADGRYRRVALFPDARIGAQGMGPTSESQSRTPTGRFPLSQAFGIKPNPGVHTTYFRVGPNDVWTGSTGTVINQHRRCAPNTCPASYGGYERLSAYPGPYDYGVFIGYNAAPPYGNGAVPGEGSAFFLHVKNAYATGGCVAVAADQMVWLLRWFRTASAPVISIGVGTDAYAPIPDRYT